MEIKERKLRKVGNSVVLTLSKELLSSLGVTESDTVIVDEEKLKAAMVKKTQRDEKQLRLEMAIAKSVEKYDTVYKDLVNK